MISGSTSNAGKNGSRLTPMPIATSASGPAIPTRGASAVASATTTTPTTAMSSTSMRLEHPECPHGVALGGELVDRRVDACACPVVDLQSLDHAVAAAVG